MVIRWPSKAEWFAIAITALGVGADYVNLLPPKAGALVLLFWIAAKTFLNMTGQSVVIQSAKEVSNESRESIEILTAKKAQPVDTKR